MSKVIFVVNVQDFAYAPPMLKIKYAGDSLVMAYTNFDLASQSDERYRVTLDAVEDGTFVSRLKTKDPTK
jgi:hypothetical protein